ncbi:hypothetical protein CC78DRAFT_598504 [Lojkania enalia]|uniref:Heterokaryon incompatibility domain-containing protein n=1 Tax=Lojkania enalia TaxID=147567 RepID=A0A9P4K1L2_9PLEO|nr:hypothetical protein CC78DRAFT_598504 [Didymosphaeria enalia]
MAAICANASVTILAVQGENANSGLKGFRGVSQPRDIDQIIHRLGTEVTVAQNPIRGNELERATDNSVWKARGWTYQEHLFARRKLIFDGDSIRWECSANIWREHTELSHDLKPLRVIYRLFESSIPDLRVLTTILHDYNRRSFTYPDALNAFSGIASTLGASFEGGFVSGLPTALFDLALLWLPNTPDFTQPTRMQRVVRLLSWKYHETLEAPRKQIHVSIFAHKESYLGAQIRCPPGWTQHHTSENPEAIYEAPDPRSPPLWFYRNTQPPKLEFWYPIPLPRPEDLFPNTLAPYISCRTQRAWLFAAEEILPNNGYRPTVSLRDQVGTWVGVLLPHDKLSMFGRPHRMLADPIELVEIAIGLCRDATSPWPGPIEIRHPDRIKTGQWYEYYWVMWIEWIEGVAYRKGLGRVCKHVWESQDRKPVDLMLG